MRQPTVFRVVQALLWILITTAPSPERLLSAQHPAADEKPLDDLSSFKEGPAANLRFDYLRAEDAATAARLKADVAYLASPALKGRKTDTGGAKLARKMVEARFKELGLAKWAKEKEYRVPFAYGTNVVGILPGSDPVLASEIVLVSAHYDHLGARRETIYFGASDNASGVAALLEAARQLSQPGRRPRRTVAFVAFDAEEKFLLGSFAFSLRPDVAAAKIAAVVNVDMLGRKFLDVVDNAVFVVGSEGYPALRESLRGAGAIAGLRVFPIASDLAGPRSDHVPFQDRGVPALFFSCGTFGDYHSPADTGERMDFGLMERSSRVIVAAVQGLADGAPVVRDPADRWEEDELRTIQPVFQEVLAQPKTAGIYEPSLKGFQKLESEAGRFLHEGGYDWNARRDMILEAMPALAARLGSLRASDTSLPGGLPSYVYNGHVPIRLLQYFNITYPEDLRQAYREAIAQVLKHRPGLLRTMPRFEYEIYRIDPKETRLTETSPGVFRLSAPAAWFSLVADPRPSLFSFHSTPVKFTLGIDTFEEEGSRQALADYWLLELRESRAHPERAEPIRAVLRLLLGKEPPAGYAEALAERLKQEGLRNESEWIAQLMRRQPRWLAVRAVEAATNAPAPMHEALAALMRDRTAPAEARLEVMFAMLPGIDTSFEEEPPRLRGRQLLSALCDVIDDPASSARIPSTVSPFPSSTMMKILLMDAPASDGHSASAASAPAATIGDLAWDILKEISRKDFPKDPAPWRAWAAKQPEIKAKR